MVVLVGLLVYVARWWTPLAVMFVTYGAFQGLAQLAYLVGLVSGRVAPRPHEGRLSSMHEAELREWLAPHSRWRRATRWLHLSAQILSEHAVWPVPIAQAIENQRRGRVEGNFLITARLRLVAAAVLLLPARTSPASQILAITFAIAVTADLLCGALASMSILERWARTKREARLHVLGETVLRFCTVTIVFAGWRVADGAPLTIDLAIATGKTIYGHNLHVASFETVHDVLTAIAGWSFYFAFLRQLKRALWWKAPPHVELARISSLLLAKEYDEAAKALDEFRERNTSWAVLRAVVHLVRGEVEAARKRISYGMGLEDAIEEDPTFRLLVAARSFEVQTTTILAVVANWAASDPDHPLLSGFIQTESGTNLEFAKRLPEIMPGLGSLSLATALLVLGDLTRAVEILDGRTFADPFATIRACYVEGAARVRNGSRAALTVDLLAACERLPAYLLPLAWSDLQLIRSMWNVPDTFERSVQAIERRIAPAELDRMRERQQVAHRKLGLA